MALVFSEYNLIESGYLFQTNLSKQWIENIRRTKTNFQLLMEESKLKFQNIHNPISPPCTSVSTNTIHHSLPSLSSPSLELPDLKATDDDQRSSKIESDVFKSVEQTRRNSRTDRKNFGRYFTADGTGTHTTNPSISPVKQLSSSSTTILKRMSWNNEKTDSSIITNSFRSVHSSSGVSSTGSFLFSTDEDSSIPSTVIEKEDTSIDSDSLLTSSDNQTIISLDLESTSLRRTPFPSVKKRNQQNRKQKILHDNDHHSSTHTIISQTPSLVASGNDSDYDNNQSPTVQNNPVTTDLNSDELLLGDQNEIILTNDTHFDNLNQQSDNRSHQIPSATLDHNVPTNFLVYHKDPLITRRLLDIRSHLLLNTTLDAT